MKIIAKSLIVFLSISLVMATVANAQSTKKEKKLVGDAAKAKQEFINTDSNIKTLFGKAYGYVVFPNVGKAGLAIGGAIGSGIVYEQGEMIGKATLTQLSIGLQFGGQAYREIIFFETEEAMQRFKDDEFEFSAQASAIALKSGVSVNAKYRDGVMIFTQQKGGLMYEASIGGQKFNYAAFE